ncbi:MAG: isopentenyl-diphosphate Delta-isomerase [Acidimicrobiales bacterium]
MPDRRKVMLVDPTGHLLGPCDKRLAHDPPGHLHLAFSVFLFDPGGRVLVQQRAATKYHFKGVWANACCSHPEPGEDALTSARRRVREELGLDCELEEAGRFTYRALDPASGLVEHEYDQVFVGTTTTNVIQPDPEEVQDWRFVHPAEVSQAGPREGYAPWFSQALGIALAAWNG